LTIRVQPIIPFSPLRVFPLPLTSISEANWLAPSLKKYRPRFSTAVPFHIATFSKNASFDVPTPSLFLCFTSLSLAEAEPKIGPSSIKTSQSYDSGLLCSQAILLSAPFSPTSFPHRPLIAANPLYFFLDFAL